MGKAGGQGLSRRARTVALTASVLGVTACGAGRDFDLPSQELEQSEHFHYYARAGDRQACPGITQDMERHRSLVFDYFAGLQTGDPIDYYKFLDDADLSAHGPCPTSEHGSRQCHSHGRIYSYEPMEQHELIHAYLRTRGPTAGFLSEGLATALSCGLSRSAVHDSQFADLFDWQDDTSAYEEASLFVAHLLNIAGPSAFLSLRDQVGPTATLEQVKAAIQAVYGASADDLYADAQSTAIDAGCVPLWECSGPAWDTKTTNYNYLSTCGQPSFTPFEVTEPSLFAGYARELRSCAPELVSPAGPGEYVAPRLVALEPGRYFLSVNGDSPSNYATGTVPAQLLPLSRAVGTSAECSTLPNIDLSLSSELAFVPRTLLQGRTGPLLLRWNDSFIAQRRASSNVLLTLAAQCSAGVTVAVCEGCDENSCQNLCNGSSSPPVEPDVPKDLVLRLSINPAAQDAIIRIALGVLEETPI